MPAPTTRSPEPRPKERVELFQQHLSDIQTKLANIDEKHKPIRKERNDETDGEWINMLKSELKDRSLNSKDSKNTQEIKENIAVKDTHKTKDDKKHSKLCSKCHNPVATVDKIVLNNLVLHRGCLTCTRCGTMLRLSEIRSKTVTECLSVNKRGKEEASNLDYLCILCCKNKVNNNSNNNVSERMISSFDDKPTMKKAPLTPPPSLPSNNTLSSTNVDKYESRLKERMKWKEIFLLNNNDIDLRSKEPKSEELISKIDNSNNKEEDKKGTTPEPKRLLNERIEYENTSISFELYDEDELTKLLNLESDQWDSEEDETETSGSWEESDSTDNDFDSDEFDMSDNLDANSSKVANGSKKVVESTVEVVSKVDSESSATEKIIEKSEKKERPMLTIELKKEESDHSNGSIDNEIEDIATPVNAIKEFNSVLRKMEFRDDKASDSDATISSVSFKGSSHFEDINLISVIDGEDESPPVKKDVKPPTPTAFSKLQSPKQTYFKVDLPKLSVFNFDNYKPFDETKPGVTTSASTTTMTSTNVKPASTTTYSKIPVLSTRIAAANATTNNSSTQRLPTYSGSFTEKLLQRCRSTPALSNKDAFTRWGTQSSLLTAGTPNSPSNKLCFEKRLSFPPKNKETKISPETPSISKLPFADSETNVDDLRSPRLVNIQSPKRQPPEAAPRACVSHHHHRFKD
ncbi:hypothetical protein B4U80_06306 [Leptotrombidium deliense]|uniref:LIM zinc-binding domain-containing protein n=1 Tax=Leptotrombidium deliense TaxID=299467 RepID=A0A443SL10_9ACAR|nr:hypothetical protein B4U80_06306 [Leptotrombidium deliense]